MGGKKEGLSGSWGAAESGGTIAAVQVYFEPAKAKKGRARRAWKREGKKSDFQLRWKKGRRRHAFKKNRLGGRYRSDVCFSSHPGKGGKKRGNAACIAKKRINPSCPIEEKTTVEIGSHPPNPAEYTEKGRSAPCREKRKASIHNKLEKSQTSPTKKRTLPFFTQRRKGGKYGLLPLGKGRNQATARLVTRKGETKSPSIA